MPYLYGIALVCFPDDDPLRIETCRNIQCYIIKYISKEQYYAFCWLNVANWLRTIHGMNSIKLTCFSQWNGDEGAHCAGAPRLPVGLSNENHCPVFQGVARLLWHVRRQNTEN
jgi:hypothetical protein